MTKTHNPVSFFVALAGAAMALLLIMLGGWISSNGYGLAITEWPHSNPDGGFLPPNLVGGIYWEFLHRTFALISGLLTLFVSFLIVTKDSRPLPHRIALLAMVLVFGQIILGGVGVRILFPTWLTVLHATLAYAYFALMMGTVAVTSAGYEASLSGPDEKSVKRLRSIATMGLFQVFLGAVIRHGSGGVFMAALGLHFLTAIGLLMVAFTGALPAARKSSHGGFRAAGFGVVGSVALQLVVGIAVMFMLPRMSPDAQPTVVYMAHALAHVTLGALVVGLSTYMTLLAGSWKRAA